MTDNKQ